MLPWKITNNTSFWLSFRISVMLWTEMNARNWLCILQWQQDHGSVSVLFVQKSIDRVLQQDVPVAKRWYILDCDLKLGETGGVMSCTANSHSVLKSRRSTLERVVRQNRRWNVCGLKTSDSRLAEIACAYTLWRNPCCSDETTPHRRPKLEGGDKRCIPRCCVSAGEVFVWCLMRCCQCHHDVYSV